METFITLHSKEERNTSNNNGKFLGSASDERANNRWLYYDKPLKKTCHNFMQNKLKQTFDTTIKI